MVKRERRIVAIEETAIEIDRAHAAVEDLRLGGGSRRLAEAREIARRVEIIRVEEDEERPPCEVDPPVSRCRGPAIRLPVDSDPLVVKASKHRRRPVRRPVVDSDDFELRVALHEHALDRVGDERFAVEDWNDDGD